MRKLLQEVQKHKNRELKSKKVESKEQEINRRASSIVFLRAFSLYMNKPLYYTNALEEHFLLSPVNHIILYDKAFNDLIN